MAAVGSLIDLTIIPWGNAHVSGGVWKCQHGPGECMGNTIESCVMHLYPQQNMFWPFVNKYEQMAHTCSRTKPGTCPVDTALKIASGMGMDATSATGFCAAWSATGVLALPPALAGHRNGGPQRRGRAHEPARRWAPLRASAAWYAAETRQAGRWGAGGLADELWAAGGGRQWRVWLRNG